jgi:hypothetical protein
MGSMLAHVVWNEWPGETHRWAAAFALITGLLGFAALRLRADRAPNFL